MATVIKRTHKFDTAIAEIQSAIENELLEKRNRSYPHWYAGEQDRLQGMQNAIRVLKGAYRPDLGHTFIDLNYDEDVKWVDDEEQV